MKTRPNRIVEELKKEFPDVDTPNIKKVVEFLGEVNPNITPTAEFKNALQSKITQEITKKKITSYTAKKTTSWGVILWYITGVAWVACFLFALSLSFTNISPEDANRSTHLLTRTAKQWNIGGLMVNAPTSWVQPLSMALGEEIVERNPWVFSRSAYESLLSGLDISRDAYVYKKHFIPSEMLHHIDTLDFKLFNDTMTSRMSIVSQNDERNPIEIDFETGNIHFSRSIDVSQIPDDEDEKISFLSWELKKSINLGWYDTPHIAEDQFYQKTSEKDLSIWYPFLIENDSQVLSEHGQELWLSVFLSYVEQKIYVQWFIGRFPYETSVYELAHEKNDILDLIEKMYRQSAPAFVPQRVKFAYIVAKHPYSQDEYLLPSLVFTGEVWDTPFSVPLTKEMYE